MTALWLLLRRYWHSRLRYPVLLLLGAAVLLLWAYSPEEQAGMTQDELRARLANSDELAERWGRPAWMCMLCTLTPTGALLTESEVLALVQKALLPAYEKCRDTEMDKMRAQLTGQGLVEAAVDLCQPQYRWASAQASYRGSGVWIVTPMGTYITSFLRDSEGNPFQRRFASGPWLFDERAGRIINQP